jgi:hypothetical protein
MRRLVWFRQDLRIHDNTALIGAALQGDASVARDERRGTRVRGLLGLSMPKAKRKAPWKRPAPEKARNTHLSAKQKTVAKRRAKRAGRRYPNLVDNMREASKEE